MKIRLVYKILIPIILFVLGEVLVFTLFSVRSVQNAMIRDSFSRTSTQVHSRFNQIITEPDIKTVSAQESRDKLWLVANEIADASIVHFTVWKDGDTIIFADTETLIGNIDTVNEAVVRSQIENSEFYEIAAENYEAGQGDAIGNVMHMYIPVTVGTERVVVEVEALVSVITQPIRTEVRNMIIIFVTGGTLIVLSLYIILRTFVLNPIQGLRTAFRAFSLGNLGFPVHKGQHDELGELASSVDAMRLNLQYSIGALRQERDQSSAIVTSMGEGLIVIDNDYTVRLINSTAERLLEVTGVQYVGRKMTDLLQVTKQGQPVAVADWLVTEAMSAKKPVFSNLEDKTYYKNPSGKLTAIIAAATPLLVGDAVQGAVLVFRDVTEEQQLDEAKDNFISVASHQLRTPLTSMRWFAEMLTNGDVGKLTEQQLHFVEQVYQGTLRMISLVNLLLQTARVEAGRVKIEPTPLKLDAVVEEVKSALKTNFDNKQQKVSVTVEPSPIPDISMDKDIIYQVILNLLSNASRYGPVGDSIEVAIKINSTEALVSVRDHGIGIPKKDYGKLFQKFFRATNALKAVPEGSGLGLSLVKTLVTQWGGKIWFESEEGKGTVFYFTIPPTGMKAKSGEVRIVV